MRQLAVLTIMLTSIALADDRPNILLIVADDLGYADLAAYGGDIDTPAIDALAKDGVLFTQFHTAPMCSPTRAMLLSGNNNHVAGIGRQRGEILDPPLSTLRENMPGYEGHLSERIAPLPRLLHEAGYAPLAAIAAAGGMRARHITAARSGGSGWAPSKRATTRRCRRYGW